MGKSYAYGVHSEADFDKLPTSRMIEFIIDKSDTYYGIVLYSKKLSEVELKNLRLAPLGVIWDERSIT